MLPIRDLNPRHGVPYVTWTIFVLNVAAFVYELTLGPRGLGRFFAEYGFVPALFFRDPVAHLPTLVTTTFLHGGWMHLIGNMLFLLVFADNVEEHLGRWKFVAFYVLGGAAAALLHGLFDTRSLAPLVGASGAIAAVLGAYLVLYPSQKVQTLVPALIVPWLVLRLLFKARPFYLFWLPAWAYLGVWAATQFASATSGMTGGPSQADDVAWWAHVGGFAVGVLWAYLGSKRSGPAYREGSAGPRGGRA